MFFLILATMCSAAIALIFKFTESRETNRYAITSANYFFASAVSLAMVLQQKLYAFEVSGDGLVTAFTSAVRGDEVMGAAGSFYFALAFGGVSGIFFFLSFVFYQRCVKQYGAGLSGTFAKMGILVPMVLSLVLWKELPTTLQWFGIALSLMAIVVVNVSKDKARRFNWQAGLLLLFTFGGLAEFSTKVFQKYALTAYKDVFLCAVFFVAFVISALYCYATKKKVVLRDILLGFCVGLPNLFSSYFLILALESVKTSVAFPLYSAGSIVLITLGSRLLFGEAVPTKNKWAIGLTVVALALLNA